MGAWGNEARAETEGKMVLVTERAATKWHRATVKGWRPVERKGPQRWDGDGEVERGTKRDYEVVRGEEKKERSRQMQGGSGQAGAEECRRQKEW